MMVRLVGRGRDADASTRNPPPRREWAGPTCLRFPRAFRSGVRGRARPRPSCPAEGLLPRPPPTRRAVGVRRLLLDDTGGGVGWALHLVLPSSRRPGVRGRARRSLSPRYTEAIASLVRPACRAAGVRAWGHLPRGGDGDRVPLHPGQSRHHEPVRNPAAPGGIFLHHYCYRFFFLLLLFFCCGGWVMTHSSLREVLITATTERTG